MKTPAGLARPIIAFIIDEALRAGFTLTSVEDGFDAESDSTEVSTKEAALKEVFATDESVLYFNDDTCWIALIASNGEDVVHDWSDEAFGEVVRTALKEMQHLECYECGHIFHEDDASSIVETIEKRRGYPAVTRTAQACPKCGGRGFEPVMRPPAE